MVAPGEMSSPLPVIRFIRRQQEGAAVNQSEEGESSNPDPGGLYVVRIGLWLHVRRLCYSLLRAELMAAAVKVKRILGEGPCLTRQTRVFGGGRCALGIGFLAVYSDTKIHRSRSDTKLYRLNH